MAYKLIIFDFDGTLANSFPLFVEITNQAAEKYHFKRIEAHELDRLRGYDAKRLVKYLGISIWKLPLVAHYMRTQMTQRREQIRIFDGVDRLLRQLTQQGVTVAIVTTNTRAIVDQVLGPELTRYVSYVACDVSMFRKAARFRKICAQSSISPQDTLCVGDEIRDLNAARQAKLAFGAVAWGYTHVESLRAHKPREVFATIDDILAKAS